MPKVKKKSWTPLKGAAQHQKCRPKLKKWYNKNTGTLNGDREKPRRRISEMQHSATYDRLYREKQDHVFQTLRRHNFLMAPLEKLPSGNRYLLAETFRKWYGSTIFVSMEYVPMYI